MVEITRIPVVCFDIDGTIANIEHRRPFVQSKPRNWPAFEKAIPLDTRYDDIHRLYHILSETYDIVFASGRGEQSRGVTEEWLYKNGFDLWAKLYMRAAKDSRRDDIVKREILAQMRADGYEPWLVFDDRNQVVDMWRSEGIRCLQVQPGNF